MVNEDLSSPGVVWPVSALNRGVRSLLERELPLLWVSGEISNLTRAASGHLYFTLKDASAQVRSVMFRNRVVLLPFRPLEGMRVEARVQVTLYEARGEFQLAVEAMRPGGQGALFEAFERLKQQLAAEGLFDEARKRPLPLFPRRVGVMTSLQAAALQDVLATLTRRAPQVQIILYPVPVQGEGAAAKIVEALALANRRNEVDVLLLCRGGGSLEDLWAFNDVALARAIAACSLPLVTGIGHETDFTMADFVADLRGATPTAAAEQIAPDAQALRQHLAGLQQRASRVMTRLVQAQAQRLDFLRRRLVHPGERIQMQRQRLARCRQALQASAARGLERQRWRLDMLGARYARSKPAMREPRQKLVMLAGRRVQAQMQAQQRLANRLGHLATRLAALDPQAVLARGYSLVLRADGTLVKDSARLHGGERVRLRFARGEAEAYIVPGPRQSPRLGQQGELFPAEAPDSSPSRPGGEG